MSSSRGEDIWQAQRMADVLLLDLDRTLVDLQSFTDYTAAREDVEQLIGTFADADVPATDWDSATQACMSVLHTFINDARWQQISDAIALHERAAIPQSQPMPKVNDAAQLFTDVPTAVITLLPTDVAWQVLEHHNLSSSIDLVLGRDPMIRPKPEPDALLNAMEHLGSTNAVMIGDSSWDGQAASRAGVRFIGVGDFGAEVEVADDLLAAVITALKA
jgi:phosphoglycolate phosphatase-like HAD superfamily hydrolase